MVKQTKPMKTLKKVFITSSNDPKPELNVPPDDDAHGLHDLLNIIDRPVNTNDYEVPVKLAKPTSSVVEVHKPQLALPDNEGIIIQNVPISTEFKVDENV